MSLNNNIVTTIKKGVSLVNNTSFGQTFQKLFIRIRFHYSLVCTLISGYFSDLSKVLINRCADIYNLRRLEVRWRQIACLVSTLVSAYLDKVKKPSHPPLDDGWMTVEMSVGLIKYIYHRSYKIVSLHTHQSDCRCGKIVYAYAHKVAVGVVK